MNDLFRRFAQSVSRATGHPYTFVIAVAVVLAWVVTGPLFRFSDTWQLVINTGTTIITFLMVFILQNTQERDNVAVHLKLDELLRAVKAARNSIVDVEELPDEDLDKLTEEFHEIHATAEREQKRLEGERAVRRSGQRKRGRRGGAGGNPRGRGASGSGPSGQTRRAANGSQASSQVERRA